MVVTAVPFCLALPREMKIPNTRASRAGVLANPICNYNHLVLLTTTASGRDIELPLLLLIADSAAAAAAKAIMRSENTSGFVGLSLIP